MKYLSVLVAFCFVPAPLHAEPDRTPPKKPDAISDPAFVVALEAIRSGPMSAKQVSDLEEMLAKYPDDLSARTKLLGWYQIPRPTTLNAKENRRKHIFWVIKNRPEAEIAGLPFCQFDVWPANRPRPATRLQIELDRRITNVDDDGYQEGKQLWLDQTRAHPKDTTILSHAASFLTIYDRALAADLLMQAEKLEPSNPKWPDQLGHLYAIGEKKETAANALAEFKKAQALDVSEESGIYRLACMAKSEFTAGEIEKARYYAEQILQLGTEHPNDWHYRYAIHEANIVLGRIALKQKHIKLANEYLLKAGDTPGEPVLDSFGPNMSLAKELLHAHQKATVLQYFELCRKFWRGLDDELDLWTKQVKAGKTPDFGANLYY
jgi:hypothetical protein